MDNPGQFIILRLAGADQYQTVGPAAATHHTIKEANEAARKLSDRYPQQTFVVTQVMRRHNHVHKNTSTNMVPKPSKKEKLEPLRLVHRQD